MSRSQRLMFFFLGIAVVANVVTIVCLLMLRGMR